VKAIVQDEYGDPDALGLRDLSKPQVGDGEVLVQVVAAGLHIGDVFAVRGSPFPVRAMTGLRRPKSGVPGADIAGRVAAVGSGVTTFKPGDDVFGVCMWPSSGASAEYTRAAQDKLVHKPAELSFEAAAASPTSGLAALHGLRDAGKIKPGQSVLINGASGGVGTFAIQIAKALGAEVTAVCSARNVELVRSLGADHVVDYTKEDFTHGPRRYDLILDNIENRPLSHVRRALTRDGTLVLNSGTGAGGLRLLVRLIRPVLLSRLVRHNLRRYLSTPNQADLQFLKALVEDGKLRPVIDSSYALNETAEALRHIETGRARGKVVIAVAAA
jgi:NADPH:quinone reductase-like Zn-dependent oxidoreductase